MKIPTLNKLKYFFKLLSRQKVLIDSNIVGSRIKLYQFSVNARQISNYAAAISDLNDVYYLSEKQNNLCSHPLFPVRISWGIIESLSEYLDIETPFNLQSQLVHHSEYLQFKRLPKPGDVLTLKGELAAVTPHHRGAKLILKFEYYDQSDQLILIEYIGSILFGVNCTDAGRGINTIPTVQRIEESTPIWSESISVPRSAPYIYDGCTEIVYPVHTDQKFARSMGLPDIILQGTATLAMSISTLLKKELGDDPRLVEVVAGKFTDVVVPPNNLTVQLLKKSSQELFFDVKEKTGQFVIRGGYIRTKGKIN